MIAYKIVRRDESGNIVSLTYTPYSSRISNWYPTVRYSDNDVMINAVPPDECGPLCCFIDEISATQFMHNELDYSISNSNASRYELWKCKITLSEGSEAYYGKARTDISTLPRGTVLADLVRIMEKII